MAVWIDETGTLVRPAEGASIQPSPLAAMEITDRDAGAAAGGPARVQARCPRPAPPIGQRSSTGRTAAPTVRSRMSPDQVVAASQPRSADHSRAAACFELGIHAERGGDHPSGDRRGGSRPMHSSPRTGRTSARRGRSSPPPQGADSDKAQEVHDTYGTSWTDEFLATRRCELHGVPEPLNSRRAGDREPPRGATPDQASTSRRPSIVDVTSRLMARGSARTPYRSSDAFTVRSSAVMARVAQRRRSDSFVAAVDGTCIRRWRQPPPPVPTWRCRFPCDCSTPDASSPVPAGGTISVARHRAPRRCPPPAPSPPQSSTSRSSHRRQPGFWTVWPHTTPRPEASNLNVDELQSIFGNGHAQPRHRPGVTRRRGRHLREWRRQRHRRSARATTRLLPPAGQGRFVSLAAPTRVLDTRGVRRLRGG
jgi:hypothetical protein